MKTKTIYFNKEVQKRADEFDMRIHEEGEKKKYIDAIEHASNEGNKSPNSMFKESMNELKRMLNK